MLNDYSVVQLLRRDRVTGSPRGRTPFKEVRGPPRLRAHPLCPRRSRTPRRVATLLAHGYRREALRFRNYRSLGIQDEIDFGAAFATARAFACLRFAKSVTGFGVGLAPGLGRLILDRAGFAPAGWILEVS